MYPAYTVGWKIMNFPANVVYQRKMIWLPMSTIKHSFKTLKQYKTIH